MKNRASPVRAGPLFAHDMSPIIHHDTPRNLRTATAAPTSAALQAVPCAPHTPHTPPPGLAARWLARHLHTRSAPLARRLTPAALLAVACAALLPLPAHAQSTIKTKPDGRWRQILGAGASYASGNSDMSSLNLHYDVARQTGHHTLGLRARALYNTSEGKTSAHNTNLEINGKRNLNERHYIFANASWFRDRIANLSHRLAAASGWGYQVTTTPNDDWSLFAGIGYSEDRYTTPTIVADRERTRYGRAELTLGTESRHQLTGTTTAHQRFVYYPAVNRNHDRRAELTADLAVSITERLALTATAELRYNSDPGTKIHRMDRRFLTGITWKLTD